LRFATGNQPAGPRRPQVEVLVPDQAAAEQARFLGSPSIRVDGRDIEPGAERNLELVHGCRLYQGAYSLQALPAEDWLRQALDNLEAQP